MLSTEVMLALVAALLSFVSAGIVPVLLDILPVQVINRLSEYIPGLQRHRDNQDKSHESYSERMARLTQDLIAASSSVDAILSEVAQVAQEREQALRKLTDEVSALESRQQELTERIEDLKNVPIPVAKHFAALAEEGEKRSARRDYVLFGAGVVTSTLISILLYVFGFA